MKQYRNIRKCASIVTSALLISFYAGSAEAAVIGEASAFGLKVDTEIVSQPPPINVVVTAQLGPTPEVSGIAPPPFDEADSAASASVSAGTLSLFGRGEIDVQAGVLDVEARSNDPFTSPYLVEAAASVADFSSDVNLVGLSLLSVANIFSFDATGLVISSEARAEGDIGSFTTFGDSKIVDGSGASAGTLTFTVLGVDHIVTLDAQGSVTPNTTLSITGGTGTDVTGLLVTDLVGTINIHLNEQIVTGDGITEAGITVNAIRIEFDGVGAVFLEDVLGLGLVEIDSTNLVTGEIIIAQSHARLIPEPGSLALLAMAGLLLTRRRRDGASN